MRIWQGKDDGSYDCKHILKDHTAEVFPGLFGDGGVDQVSIQVLQLIQVYLAPQQIGQNLILFWTIVAG